MLPADPTELEIANDLAGTDGPDDPPLSDAPGPEVLEEEYPTWTTETTRVISGPIGARAAFPGIRYPTWGNAMASVARSHAMVKFWTLGPRWFARVKR